MKKLNTIQLITLFAALLICIGYGLALAGGGDGSEVLGPIKASNDSSSDVDKGTLMDSVNKMLSKDGDSSDKSDGSDDDGKNGKKVIKPNEIKADKDSSDKNRDNSEKNKKSAKDDDGFPMDCFVTPSIMPDHVPEKKIKKGNNLLRQPGSARRANGQYVEIIGKIVDEDCVPISDAEVQIWQTDSAGKYEDEYTQKSEWDTANKGFDKNFGYSGAAQTNNLGEFSFLTILPAMKNKESAPHINFYVRHPDFEKVATMMYFDKHPKNDTDKGLKSLPEDQRDLLIAKGRKLDPSGNFEGRVYGFMITLGGMNKYRRY